MKRFVYSLILSAVCLRLSADVITPSQALAIAEDFLNESLTPSYVSGMRGTVRMKEEEPAPLYIISRGENLGWVIVSGDDSLPDIIGYTDTGNFDADNMPPAYKDLLDNVTSAVMAAQRRGAGSRLQYMDAAGEITVDPLLTTHWHQNSPYNDLCPVLENGSRAVTGCVATAAAQVVYYFRKDLPRRLLDKTPIYGNVTVSYPKGTPILYELMFDSYSNNEPKEFKDAVALLCYTIGTAAKLSYGTSTSGYTSEANRVMQSHFGLGGNFISRGNMDISKWEEIVYESLVQYKPVLHGGNGHATVIDGYKYQNGHNLWHFNFGWGGGSDGWYTLDNGDSSIVYDITPTNQPMHGELQCNGILYHRMNNTVKARITNNSTACIKGLKLYLMTSDKAPNSSNAPIADDDGARIEPGESEITFNVRPLLARDYYAYLTDAQLNVLDKCKVTVVESEPDFSLNGIDVNASNDIVNINGLDFRILRNKNATINADISNSASGTPGQPTVKFELYKWNRETGEESLSIQKTISTNSFETGECLTLSNTFKNLASGTYYIGRISCDEVKIECPDSVVRFYVDESSLVIDTIADGVAKVRGGWDPTIFTQLATDPSVNVYDLRAVTGVTSNISAANPNALFYVTGNITGRNIVNDGQCAVLSLTTGYDFCPLAPFHADYAEFKADLVPAVWNTLALPFECQRPDGWLCRYVTEMSSTAITAATIVDTLLPSQAYLVMSDSRDALPFTATNVDVMATVDTTQMTPFIGTYYAIKTAPLKHDGDTYILSLDIDPTNAAPYFNKMDTSYVLPPFQAVISSQSKKIRATVNNTLETAYRKLATAIDEAQSLYDEMHTQITDSANIAMETVLAEARKTFFLMSEETTGNLSVLTKQLNTTIENYPLMLKRITHPIDYSALLTNPSFEINSKKGWTCDVYSAVKSSTDFSTFGACAGGNYLLYNNKYGASTAIYQTVTGLPDGYYRASAMLGTVEGGIVTFYANDKEVEVPASEYGKYYLSEAVIDSIRVENGEITIGVRAGETWYKADDFRLYYIGHLYNDDITAIESVKLDEMQPVANDNIIYDMMGRRIVNPNDMQPGRIYIHNGRKIMKVE